MALFPLRNLQLLKYNMIEKKIRDYVISNYKNYNFDNIHLYKLLSFVEMKDKIKYLEFKLELKKDGWII